MLIQPTVAYIDPSVMTFAAQAIAGAVIAIGAVVAVLWRRAKKKVEKTLGLEEKTKKEVEDDIRLTDTTDSAESTEKTDEKN